MELDGKKVAILVEDRYQVLELWYPLIRLREAGAEVIVVGPEAGKVYKSGHGYEITSQISVRETNIGTFDALLIPGGYAPDLMRRIPEMVGLVREAYKNGMIVAAICHAGWMLASAGIVKGKRVTSYYSIKDDMVHAGAIWEDQPVVRDGQIITSRKPDDLPLYCREIIAALQE